MYWELTFLATNKIYNLHKFVSHSNITIVNLLYHTQFMYSKYYLQPHNTSIINLSHYSIQFSCKRISNTIHNIKIILYQKMNGPVGHYLINMDSNLIFHCLSFWPMYILNPWPMFHSNSNKTNKNNNRPNILAQFLFF